MSELVVAASRGYEKMVKLLIQRGATINLSTFYYGTALQAASDSGPHQNEEERIVRVLLESGGDPNHVGDNESPLAYITLRGNLTLCNLLLDHGADPNIRCGSKDYGDALSAAAAMGQESAVQLLLDKGAKTSERAFYQALEGQDDSLDDYHERIVELFVRHGVNLDPDQENGAPLNPHGEEDLTAGNTLQAATFDKDTEIFSLPLDRGVNIEEPGANRRHVGWPYGSAFWAVGAAMEYNEEYFGDKIGALEKAKEIPALLTSHSADSSLASGWCSRETERKYSKWTRRILFSTIANLSIGDTLQGSSTSSSEDDQPELLG
ncbi:ankyrin [Glonium stellatum]|uniref:Ankyrin n=1 Tax=Glonium stellatum TaxID=574774 RepID=A0A8E2EUX9_9PEZI|nr:ankyrin [Glonium stellatum]